MSDVTFADGVICKKSKYSTKVAIKLSEFKQFANKHFKKDKNGEAWLNLELKESKAGKPYMKLDEFEPKKQEEETEDLPF